MSGPKPAKETFVEEMQGKCYVDRDLNRLTEESGFKLDNPALQSYIEWLYRRGEDPVRLAKLMLVVHENHWVQSHLYHRIRNNYHGLTNIEDLETEIERIIIYVSGTAQSSFGIDDIALLSSVVSGAAAKLSRLEKITELSAHMTVATLRGGRQIASPIARAWGLKLIARMKGLGLNVDQTYAALRMKRYDKYAALVPRTRGVSGKLKAYRSVPKTSKFPFYDAHPKSLEKLNMRYHLPGERAVYFSESKAGVAAEMTKHSGSTWSNVLAVKGVRLKYRNALDLTDPAVLKTLQIDEATLYGTDLSHGQVIASIARSLGFDAIISKSAAGAAKMKNLTLLRKEIIAP